MSFSPGHDIRPAPHQATARDGYEEARRELLRRFDQLWRGELGSIHVHSDRGSVFLTPSPRALETKRLK